MPKIILICGKICSGKTTYTKKLIKEIGAVHLSCDEIMLALLGQHVGDKHDEYVEKTMLFLYDKSIEIYHTGINVAIDLGFWRKNEREDAKKFYKSHGIIPEWHYISISNETWQKNLAKRNKLITDGYTNDYYIDNNIANKFWNIFEEPTKDEIDVWVENDWR